MNRVLVANVEVVCVRDKYFWKEGIHVIESNHRFIEFFVRRLHKNVRALLRQMLLCIIVDVYFY